MTYGSVQKADRWYLPDFLSACYSDFFSIILFSTLSYGRLNTARSTPVSNVPSAFEEPLKQTASTCPEIPISVFAAQVDVESSWNSTAISPLGAVGLAQIRLPEPLSTYSLDSDGDGKKDPYSPYDNLSTQVNLMCTLYHKTSSLRYALSSYNTGYGGRDSRTALAYADKVLTKSFYYLGVLSSDFVSKALSFLGAVGWHNRCQHLVRLVFNTPCLPYCP